MRMLLIQASVENGFSVHRQVMLQNLKERSFIAQWTIHNHLLDIGGLDALVVDKLLLLAASSGRQKFTDYLERQRAKSAKGVKRKALSDEITALEKRQKTVQSLSRCSERHGPNHEIKCIPPVCEGERWGTRFVGKENLRNFVRTCKGDQISKYSNIQYCKFHTAQIAYIVTIVRMSTDECGIVGLTLS